MSINNNCNEAARKGNLEDLKRYHKDGNELTIWSSAVAASMGHLECLKYCLENGNDWGMSIWISASAAQNGQLECLKYCIENGCEWDNLSSIYASIYGHFNCFKYLFEKSKNPQEFWNYEHYNSKITDAIDLDDNIWRRVFDLDLKLYPDFQSRVEAKKKEIEKYQQVSKEVLLDYLPKDVVEYCLYKYF
jgi:hypothetical protein